MTQLDGMFHVESGHLILAHDNDVYACEPVRDQAHEWRLYKGTSRTWLIQGELDTCLNHIADLVLPLDAPRDTQTKARIEITEQDIAEGDEQINRVFDRWTKEVQREPGEDILS